MNSLHGYRPTGRCPQAINSHAVLWSGHILITFLLIFDCFVREWEKSSFFLIIKKLMKATEYRGMISNSTSVRSQSPSCLRYGAGTGRRWPGHRKNLTTLHKVCATRVYLFFTGSATPNFSIQQILALCCKSELPFIQYIVWHKVSKGDTFPVPHTVV